MCKVLSSVLMQITLVYAFVNLPIIRHCQIDTCKLYLEVKCQLTLMDHNQRISNNAQKYTFTRLSFVDGSAEYSTFKSYDLSNFHQIGTQVSLNI